jgi:hypothetical protein
MKTLRKLCLVPAFALAAWASSAQALVLGGTNVPKEKMVVYLLIGHSNMAGVDAAHADGGTNPHDWNWPVASKQWVLAKEPVGGTKAMGLSGHGEGGPGMPFLKGMAAAYPDYWFGVINNASLSSTCRGENTGGNSSGLDPADNRYFKGTYLYEQMVTAAKAVQPEVTIGGILCMLGTVEATRTNETVCRAFSDDVTQLIKDLRADLGMPNLPFIMGGYEAGATGDFALSLPLPAIIDAQIKLIPGKLPTSAVVDSKGIAMLDEHHYSADKGQPEWAKRAIALIQSNKWFPGAASTVLAGPRPQGPARTAIGFAAGTMWLRADAGAWGADGRAGTARGAAYLTAGTDRAQAPATGGR